MDQPQIEISSIANIFSRQMHFLQAGDTELGHAHQFDHMTLLASGSLRVTIEGHTSEFKAPKMIYINKDKIHELVALEDNTVAYCIHAIRWGSGVNDIIDPACIPAGSNAMDFCRELIK